MQQVAIEVRELNDKWTGVSIISKTFFFYINTRVFQDSRFSLKEKAEPTKHKPGGHIERIQKDF